jgi:hypothetical protein
MYHRYKLLDLIYFRARLYLVIQKRNHCFDQKQTPCRPVTSHKININVKKMSSLANCAYNFTEAKNKNIYYMV